MPRRDSLHTGSISRMDLQSVLAFLLTMQEINQNPRILPNYTLGYDIYDNYFDARMIYDGLLDLLTTGKQNIPNYRCGNRKKLTAVVEGTGPEISIQIANMMGIYKISQVSYGITSHGLRDPTQLPFYCQMGPEAEKQYLGIAQLLLHFQWTWIGLMATDTESGDQFMRIFPPLVNRRGICVAFSLSIPVRTALPSVKNFPFSSDVYRLWRNVSVLIFYREAGTYGDILFFIDRSFRRWMWPYARKVWIIVALRRIEVRDNFLKVATSPLTHGIFSLTTQKDVQSKYFSVMWEFGRTAFLCRDSKPALTVKEQRRCEERETLKALSRHTVKRLLSLDNFYTANAILAVVQALHAAYSWRSKWMLARNHVHRHRLPPWQIHAFLRNVPHYNTSMSDAHLDEDGDMAVEFNIMKWMQSSNTSFYLEQVGRVERQGSAHLKVTIDPGARLWSKQSNQVGKSIGSILLLLLSCRFLIIIIIILLEFLLLPPIRVARFRLRNSWWFEDGAWRGDGPRLGTKP